MTEEIKSLIQLLALRKINEQEFLSTYFKGKQPNKEYCLKLLKDGLSNNETEKIEEALIVMSVANFNDDVFSEALCVLLSKDWHYSHEVIAMLLKNIKDPSTVNGLYYATELQFEYLNYDDTFQFARKCIKALAAIGNENAIDKLRLLTKSNIHIISEYAKKELRYKNLE